MNRLVECPACLGDDLLVVGPCGLAALDRIPQERHRLLAQGLADRLEPGDDVVDAWGAHGHNRTFAGGDDVSRERVIT